MEHVLKVDNIQNFCIRHCSVIPIDHTHARQCESAVVATKQVNGKGRNSAPRHVRTPQQICAKIGMDDYAKDITRNAKISSRSLQGCMAK